MAIALGISVGLALLAALVWRASKGLARPLHGLDRPIRGLLRQGYDGGFLVIRRYRETPFVQLRKYIREPGQYGIELSFPLANWSKPFQPRLERLCEEHGLRYSRDVPNGEMSFLFVDFRQDVSAAHRFVIDVLTRAFGWSEDTRCFTLLEHGDPRDVLIDR